MYFVSRIDLSSSIVAIFQHCFHTLYPNHQRVTVHSYRISQRYLSTNAFRAGTHARSAKCIVLVNRWFISGFRSVVAVALGIVAVTCFVNRGRKLDFVRALLPLLLWLAVVINVLGLRALMTAAVNSRLPGPGLANASNFSLLSCIRRT
ncbi:hypothetical protein GALMADRAFT_1148556 [Galerina marginata CBS 339.88]|uniref:Uncharacterized protein n=1 Tax=Galerina marginata (strain CBS 339.88) TaxID=685588 RepID=A0A067S6G9_GALM3|nr:hypothetical protein GALMADRAFT_1148556 [Galerina marginata CBS 339.88]